MGTRKLIDLFVYVAVRALIAAVQAMPLSACRAVARWLAVLAADVLGVRGRVTDENLRLALPELSHDDRRRLSRRMWEHLLLMVAEIAHAPRKMHPSNWRRYIRVDDMQRVVRFLLSERPKVLVSGHYGNFELCGYYLGMMGFATYTVARPLDNPYLDRFVNRFRAATGQHILPKQGSSPAIARLLAAGGALAVLGDQAAGPKGCWVDFFGHPASTHKAVAVFALANDAPLAVGYARRTGEPLCYAIGFDGVADPRELAEDAAEVRPLTQWYADRLERIVRRAPEQYWWIHRRWKGEPPRRNVRRAA